MTTTSGTSGKGALKTPLARARGMGSAHTGVHHWIHQRITSVANIPLVIWFVYSVVSLLGADYGAFTGWLAQPLNAILMILFIVSVLYHAVLGLQVVIEDYIHHEGCKIKKLVLMKLLFIALGVAAVFSVLKIAL